MSTKNKRSPRNDFNDAEFNEFISTIAPKTFSTEQTVVYFVFGLLLALTPLYLYSEIYNLGEGGWISFYGVICAAAAALLTMSYRNVELNTSAALESSRKFGSSVNFKKVNVPRATAEKIQDDITAQESQAWALFINNAIFVGSFLFFAFYVLRAIDTGLNFSISILLSAVITWQLSNSVSPSK